MDDYDAGQDWVPRGGNKRPRRDPTPGGSVPPMGLVNKEEFCKMKAAYDDVLKFMAALEARLAALEAKVGSRPMSIPS